MMTGQEKIEKIDHKTKPDPVNEVADGAAADQGKRNHITDIFTGHFPVQHANGNQGRHGNADEKKLPPPGRMAGQKAKGRAGIGQVGDMKKARYNLE